MRQKLRTFLSRHPHMWTTLYLPLYLGCFMYLEGKEARPYHVIHFPLDQMIPFCEYFIIPVFVCCGRIRLAFFQRPEKLL